MAALRASFWSLNVRAYARAFRTRRFAFPIFDLEKQDRMISHYRGRIVFPSRAINNSVRFHERVFINYFAEWSRPLTGNVGVSHYRDYFFIDAARVAGRFAGGRYSGSRL
jgi:hypothetical protein